MVAPQPLTTLLAATLLVPLLTAPAPGPSATGAPPAPAGQTAARGYVAPVPGPVVHLFDLPARRWEPGHRGVDLQAPAGAAVASPGPGTVTFAGPVAGKPVVVVTHPDGLRSSLEPVTATVPAGTAVAAGDPVGVLSTGPGDAANPDHCSPASPAVSTGVGLLGTGAGTGAGTGPRTGAGAPAAAAGGTCVHWGVRRGDVYLDPLVLLGLAAPIVLLPAR
ncbi:peptidoglycan DD-metalloendopeptidase family protein [Xylanimonas oleitrophica]|nr:peptidoglycan DD-metalloendopeptidase family protein [Xylanimonas oleitrophica]